jgi:hypothetical protein
MVRVNRFTLTGLRSMRSCSASPIYSYRQKCNIRIHCPTLPYCSKRPCAIIDIHPSKIDCVTDSVLAAPQVTDRVPSAYALGSRNARLVVSSKTKKIHARLSG